MRLTLQQIAKLVDLIQDAFSIDEFRALTFGRLGIDFDTEAPNGPYDQRVRDLVDVLQARGLSGDLVEAVGAESLNASQRRTLQEILSQDFVAPTNDPHEAILLGRLSFMNRTRLRQHLKEFTNPGAHSGRVIVVRGPSPSGKTHSWHLVRHLAHLANAKPEFVPIGYKASCGPVDLMLRIRRILGLSDRDWPVLADDPQESQASVQLADWFMGRLPELRIPRWLVIDDLNGPSPTLDTLELVNELAVRIENAKPDNLWLVLLGFDRRITGGARPYILEDDALPPSRVEIEAFFRSLGTAYGQNLSAPVLTRFVEEALAGATEALDHDGLAALVQRIERLSARVQEAGGFPT